MRAQAECISVHIWAQASCWTATLLSPLPTHVVNLLGDLQVRCAGRSKCSLGEQIGQHRRKSTIHFAPPNLANAVVYVCTPNKPNKPNKIRLLHNVRHKSNTWLRFKLYIHTWHIEYKPWTCMINSRLMA